LQSTVLPSNPSIVFVHLGPSLPEYLPIAIAQAHLFNPTFSIYLLANETALKNHSKELTDLQVKLISCESLLKNKFHKKFIARSKLDKKFRNGFWTFTTERFFYLEEFLEQYKLSDVFHVENDIMLYTNLEELLPIFRQNYTNMIGATFDNDHRCIPGFLYISNVKPLKQLVKFIAKRAHKSNNDMKSLAQFRKKYHKQWIEHLPILPPEYTQDHTLISTSGSRGTDPSHFFKHFEKFNSIFDAAAIGQYLGGIDPWHKNSDPGFINEECVFNPQNFCFYWKEDNQGRKIPIIAYKEKECKINNLHIHSKNLNKFKSR